MDDSVVLKFVYKGKETKFFVEDVDLVNLLDMIINYWDKAEREEHLMPEHPRGDMYLNQVTGEIIGA